MRTQNTETPIEFVEAVQEHFQIQFMYDLAASPDNSKAFYYTTEEDDALTIDWPRRDWCWLNPPFRSLTKWINKCYEQYQHGCRIISIWPTSSDLNQIPAFKHAQVYLVHGRVWGLVRGCMLTVWDKRHCSGISGLRWDKKTLTRIW